MFKFISLFLLCVFSTIGQASYTFQITDDPNSEKFKNRKIDFITYWMDQEFKLPIKNQPEISETQEELIKQQKQQYLEMRWEEYLKEDGQYFILAEEVNGDPVAFLFYTLTQRQTEGKDEKKWAFLSGYAICPGKENEEEEIIPSLLDSICMYAKTPRILTGTARSNKKMQEKLTKFKFVEEKFEKKVTMKPNWLEKYPLTAALYYKLKI